MGKPIIIVQGGQYGSEAKGLITAKLVKDRRVDVAIRTGTVNAGHTVYYQGRPYAMQQIPVAWVRPECRLVLGPGAYIHPEILAREIEWINQAMPDRDVRDRLFIDRNCGLHTEVHTNRSAQSGRHHSMGATGKGSSEAVIDKINGRGDPRPESHLFVNHIAVRNMELLTVDTVDLVNRWYDQGDQILIEGTQGTLLDLHLGPYPYTTHKQTQAANWMAEAGLSVTLPVELVSVMRTYPIRVAGNSGPLPQEVSWTQLAQWINFELNVHHHPHLIPDDILVKWQAAVIFRTGTLGDPAHWDDAIRLTHSHIASEVHREAWESLDAFEQAHLRRLFEMTTVTKKLRRIAQWNHADAMRSIMLNRPSSVALTFLNYVFPQAWGVTRVTFGDLPISVRRSIVEYVKAREDELGVRIGYIGFGPSEESTFQLWDGEAFPKAEADHAD